MWLLYPGSGHEYVCVSYYVSFYALYGVPFGYIILGPTYIILGPTYIILGYTDISF